MGISESELEEALTKEINELLSEIETKRRQALESSEQGQDDTLVSDPTLKTRGSPKPSDGHTEKPSNEGGNAYDPPSTIEELKGGNTSRHNNDRVRPEKRTSPTTHSTSSSPPPAHPLDAAPPSSKEAVLSGVEVTSLHSNRIRYDSATGKSHYEQTDYNDEQQTTLPDRPTLCNFASARSSPFRRYLGLPDVISEPSVPSNHIPVHKRLGISKETFDALLTAEIDEVLVGETELRNRSEVPEGEPSSAPEERLAPLTQEDCLALFRKNGYPDANSPGSLWGVYWWAANLGRAKFYCDFDVDNGDFSFLDA